MYDLFISYRRDGGHEIARLIYEKLTLRGLNCFFDHEELGSGYLNVKPSLYIEKSDNLVLILSPNSLDRCKIEGDPMCEEIASAIKRNKNIVPVILPGFSWSADLPEAISSLPYYSGLQFKKEYLDASISRLIDLLALNRELSESSAKLPAQSKADVFLKKALLSLEYEEWSNAKKYCDQALLIAPNNAEIYVCLLMADLHVKKQSDLRDCKYPFDDEPNYEKALYFADKELRESLSGYVKHIRSRIDNAKYEKIYVEATEELKLATKAKEYEKAFRLFDSILSYKDSEELAKKAKLLQRNALSMTQSQRTEAIYASAVKKSVFSTI